jgi:enolase-phosphatase E1
MNSPAVILLDIEGTTTDIRFVSDVLFPYARAHLAAFLRENQHDVMVQEAIHALKALHLAEPHAPAWGKQADASAALPYLDYLMEHDRKVTPLKTLQGMVWAEGYRSGLLKSHLYPDVLPALRRWKAEGKTLAIYSSGSVQAQKLLFGHSTEGDITPYFQAYFDTTIGSKKDPASYAAIGAALNAPLAACCFYSDNLEEIAAAAASGMQAVAVYRNGKPAVPGVEVPGIIDFQTA